MTQSDVPAPAAAPRDWSQRERDRLATTREEQASRLRRAAAVRGEPSGSVYANTLYQSLDDGRWRHVANGRLADD